MLQAVANAAQTQERIALGLAQHFLRHLVGAKIKRAQRAGASLQHQDCVFVGLKLFLFVWRRITG